MARLLGPDAGSRLVYIPVGTTMHLAPGLTATIYSDTAGTVLADILTYDGTTTPGAAIAGSTVTVDTYSQIPRFWYPDGADTVYISVNGGPAWPANADYDPRLDTADAYTVNALTYGADPTGTADSWAAISDAIEDARNKGLLIRADPDDYVAHDHRGANVYLPAGQYIINSPIVLPRSGTYRSNTVGLVGQHMDSTRLVAGPSFPSNRALIEWEIPANPLTTDVRDQTISDLTLVPKNAVGSYAIWFPLIGSRASYGTDLNAIDTMYNCRFENLIVYGNNTYHQAVIRLEGRVDFSLIRNVQADFTLGAVYTTRLFQFDDLSMWTSLTLAGTQLYDGPGFNFGIIDQIGIGHRGGACSILWGRINATQVSNFFLGGTLGQTPSIYIRDGGLITGWMWTSEGFGENGIVTLENCVGVTVSELGLGVTDQATAPLPGSGLRLINVQKSRFVNRQAPTVSPAFSAYNSKLVRVDATCKDIAFIGWNGTASYASEWDVDAAATGISVDYTDVISGIRTSPTTVLLGDDVALTRSAANVLETSDQLLLDRNATLYTVQLTNPHATGEGIIVVLGTGTRAAVKVRVVGDTQNRAELDADGTLWFGSGAATVDTSLARTGTSILSTDSDFRISTAGKGLRVKEGSNAKMGTATLAAGTATVATTAVTASSRIQVTGNSDGGTPGWLRVSARTAGTSFVITSSSGTDTSTVAWFIVEPG